MEESCLLIEQHHAVIATARSDKHCSWGQTVPLLGNGGAQSFSQQWSAMALSFLTRAF